MLQFVLPETINAIFVYQKLLRLSIAAKSKLKKEK